MDLIVKPHKVLKIATELILNLIFFKQTTENEVFDDKILMDCSKT